MGGFDNEVLNCENVDFRGVSPVQAQMVSDGQILIGSAASPNIRVGSLSSSDSSVTFTVGAGTIDLSFDASSVPTIPTTFNTDSGPAVPALNTITFATGSGITTSGSGNTVTFSASDGLAALEALSGTGIVVHTGANTYTERTLVGTTDFIDVTNGDGVAGNPTFSIATNFKASGAHSWDGSILESAVITITEAAGVVSAAVTRSGGGDLHVVFSDGYYNWTGLPASVNLTVGSDTSPQINYLYFLQSTKTLTASTTGWPATEHAPLATILCQSAASLATNGPYKVHYWTDHVVSTNNMGHISHLNYWIRQQQATYVSGLVQTYTINAATSPDEVTISTTAGLALQLHNHDIPAFAAADDYYVVNDSVTPYKVINDLNEITLDATGATINNRYYSLVMWICVSEDAADCKRFINLPGGSYASSTDVINDAFHYANYTIPDDFRGTGVLVSEWKLRLTPAGSGTFTSIEELDLRGLFPAVSAGGGAAGDIEFADNTFRIFDDGDDTRKIAFQASGITTGTTRTLTVPNADGTILVSFAGDSGTATPTSTGAVTIAGGTGITSVAGTNTVTINLDTPVSAANGGTNQSTYTTGDILYSSATNTLSKLAVGSDTQVLTLASGVPTWAPAPGSGAGNYPGINFSDDFVYSADISSASQQYWSDSGIAAVVSSPEGGHNGVIRLTGDSAGALHLKNNAAFIAGTNILTYVTYIKLQSISSGSYPTQRFGLGSTQHESDDQVDGFYFEFDADSSANWKIKTASSSSRTSTTTSTAATTNWVVMKIVVNAAATSVEYFADEVSIGTISTNIPTAAFGCFWQVNTNSSTTYTQYIDKVLIYNSY